MSTIVPAGIVGEASLCTTAGAVSTKLCSFRWILDKIEVAMSHYSSKMNYRGATDPSNFSTTVAQWIAIHFWREKFGDRFQVKASFLLFLFLFFFLIFVRSMCIRSFIGNVITYFMVISYRTTAFFFVFPNLKWNEVSVLIIPEYSSSIQCFSASNPQTSINARLK